MSHPLQKVPGGGPRRQVGHRIQKIMMQFWMIQEAVQRLFSDEVKWKCWIDNQVVSNSEVEQNEARHQLLK